MGSVPSTATMYCRKCGYALVGLSENRCPECGRGFDPGDRKTFARSPRGWWVRRWVKRAALAIGCSGRGVPACGCDCAGQSLLALEGRTADHRGHPATGRHPSVTGSGRPVRPTRSFQGLLAESALARARLDRSGVLNLSRRVGSVEYTNASRTGEDLGILAELPWLHSVAFAGTHLDGNALAPLERAVRRRSPGTFTTCLSPETTLCA